MMQQIPIVMSVAAGGGLGAALRYSVGLWFSQNINSSFPGATLFVNIAGSFMMGLIIVFLMTKLPSNTLLHAFLAIGVLGGFTTFSSFSLDVITMVERGAIMQAGTYIALSVILSIAAVFLGFFIGRSVL